MIIGPIRVLVGAIVAAVAAILAVVGITLATVPRGRCETPKPRDSPPGDPAPGCYPNPLICVDSEALVQLPVGTPAQYAQCGMGTSTLVRAQGGFVGLDAGAQTRIRFAMSAGVRVSVVHFSSDPVPGTVEGVASGAVVTTRPLLPTPGVLQEYAFAGTALDSVVVRPASQSFVTLVIQWCH